MRFVVISGRSGSGKSSALHLLEDEGFLCIDNLPVTLLEALIDQFNNHNHSDIQKVAIGIDARNIDSDLSLVQEVITKVKQTTNTFDVVFLDSKREVLIKRFSETRRRHPLSNSEVDLVQAIDKERDILQPLSKLADMTFDTSQLSLHQLRSLIKKHVVGEEAQGTSITLLSFGFKFGLPIDADLVFDVRCLPNPYWEASLRPFSGKDQPVIDFLESEEKVHEMYDDILSFVKRWIPSYELNNRSYLTVAIGCTGGRHRSVYLCERIAKEIQKSHKSVLIKHRQLED